jgi:hypothetical protein
MAEKLEFPQVYRNEEGVELIALNDVQGAAFKNRGFEPVGKYVEKTSKQTKTE